MQFPGKAIAHLLESEIKKAVAQLHRKKHSVKLSVILVGQSPEQMSYVKMKQITANKLGIGYKIIQVKTTPPFEQFARLIKKTAANPEVNGIVIQQPLPAQIRTESVYDFVPLSKEIEGHRHKTIYIPPIGQAVLTTLKWIYYPQKAKLSVLFDSNKDQGFFKKIFHHKKIILIGRGITGGQPIGKTLSAYKINYLSLNSTADHPEEYIKDADIIISAVGKNVVLANQIKPGVILINVGLRYENNKLVGDYNEKEIKNICSFYTTTPGGVGPIDVLYLYKNLIEATKNQYSIK
ncbi:hypothetical protein AUK04_03310 [Candidatus Roizmanbacteria bacterium CG2_30_33_16]|uniref:Methenyltetrahydrofolate cyclohydrolase n=1 Tax=Candidatus Roizmanbacteria bacterium CG2_30_33_16 TaxID=1805340 RepID=A0A1J5HG45_9BACT|nr:MAG: hypothetical protein AUK04_03310 [Candidatus Roizmanbacteria bacterium CG2_30_33_16]